MVSWLIGFAVILVVLAALSRWISRRVQVLGLRLTGDEQIAIMGYYLLMLPGIFLHELSHFAMARLLGLRVGKFSMGPRRRGKFIELGSVTIGSGGVLRDSLVGLAPFITGTLALVLVGFGVFDVAALGQAWRAGGWGAALRALNGIWRVPDFWLWVYAIFVISNAMMPSPADRRPWLVAGIYLALTLGLAYLLIGLPALPSSFTAQVAGVLQTLTMGFAFTLALDVAAALILWLAEVLVIAGSRRQV